MNKIIEEGTLRLSRTESTCDVILSCNGRRLMAHKLVLSIASPVLRELLEKRAVDHETVVILPDVGASTISTMLDYIYTGTALVRSGDALREFLSVAELLRIAVDPQSVRDPIGTVPKKEDENEPSPSSSRTVPELLPIGSERRTVAMMREKRRDPKKVCNIVVPSPWCQRKNGDRVLGDPRAPSPLLRNCDQKIPFSAGEDSNNNFEQIDNRETTRQSSRKLDTVIRHLYLTNPELRKNASREDLAERRRDVAVPEPYRDRVKRTFEDAASDSSIQFNVLPFSKQLRDLVSPQKPANERACISVSPREGRTIEPTPDQLGALREATNLSSGMVDKRPISDDSNSTGSDSNNCEKTVENAKKKPFKCDDCGKTFSQLRNYKYHRSVHEGTKAFSAKCPECGKTFNDRGYLSSHMKIHRDRKEYACPHCPKRFNQRVAYNMHLRIHTGVKPHECPTCGKSFSRKMLLKQHQRVHTGERPYSCPECGKSFADRSNMSLHARLHTGVKPYACSICPKSFTKKHHLKTHMNFHTGLKPYSCQNCGLAFSQSSNMRTHYKKCILKEIGNATRTEDSNSATDNT